MTEITYKGKMVGGIKLTEITYKGKMVRTLKIKRLSDSNHILLELTFEDGKVAFLGYFGEEI